MYTVGLQLKSYYTVSIFADLTCMPKIQWFLEPLNLVRLNKIPNYIYHYINAGQGAWGNCATLENQKISCFSNTCTHNRVRGTFMGHICKRSFSPKAQFLGLHVTYENYTAGIRCPKAVNAYSCRFLINQNKYQYVIFVTKI